MSEDISNEELLMVCPFYLHSYCFRGDNCEFAHEMTNILPEDVMCEFYQRGICKYNDRCWYSHGKPKKKSSVKYSISIESRTSDTKDSELSVKPKTHSTHPIKMRYTFRAPRRKTVENIPLSDEIKEIIAELRQSYLEILKKSDQNATLSNTEKLPMEMCVYYDDGKCPLGVVCPCLHGNYCELCRKYCLHPYDPSQRRNHTEECEKELERDMELSFSIHHSKDKTCGICLEIVWDKEKIAQRKFGILVKCNHVFCYSCIKQWRRKKKSFDITDPESIVDHRLMRACPQCRTTSDFIVPSNYWFGSDKEKLDLIDNYKKSMKQKHCKYFRRGEKDCPFGGNCFYLHVLPDGTGVELPPPVPRPAFNRNGNVNMLDESLLWNYLEARDELEEETSVTNYVNYLLRTGLDSNYLI